MKSKLLGLFLVLGLLITPVVVSYMAIKDQPFEGQDAGTPDFFIGEMDEQYTDDEKYLQGKEDHSMPKEKPKAKKEKMNKETQNQEAQDEDEKEQEIFE